MAGTSTLLVLHVVGVRPNFMKAAPVIAALEKNNIPQLLVHTGQHFNREMSNCFFKILDMPAPDFNLAVHGLSRGQFISTVATKLGAICLKHRPDLVVVYGDVDSTLAAALMAAKLNLPISHIEAGLRSGDAAMPEEFNRILVDYLSTLLFTTEASAMKNLEKEGIGAEKVFFVGNCMIDTLKKFRARALQQEPWKPFGLSPGNYGVFTCHRPANVDDPQIFLKLMKILNEVAQLMPIVFPVHPRTQKMMDSTRSRFHPDVHLCSSLNYLEFIGLISQARVVLTDSGGVQEETSCLNIPCLTLRKNTERPITITIGTNEIVGHEEELILATIRRIIAGDWKKSGCLPLWDGQAAERIASIIMQWLRQNKEPASR